MIIPTQATFSLLFHALCTLYPISVSNIPPSRNETNQANFDSSPSHVILQGTTLIPTQLPLTTSV